MTRKNIKVPESLFLALRDDKGDNQSWPHYLESECLHEADAGNVDEDAIADTVADRVGATLSEVTWEQLDAADLAQQTAAYVERRDNVTLEASERRAIAEEVAEVLR